MRNCAILGSLHDSKSHDDDSLTMCMSKSQDDSMGIMFVEELRNTRVNHNPSKTVRLCVFLSMCVRVYCVCVCLCVCVCVSQRDKERATVSLERARTHEHKATVRRRATSGVSSPESTSGVPTESPRAQGDRVQTDNMARPPNFANARWTDYG